jgi:hypothetical protein
LTSDDHRLLDRANHSALTVMVKLAGKSTLPAYKCRSPPDEGDRVGSGSQVDDPVLTLLVADHRAGLFDEDRACGLDRYAGEDGARRIPYDSHDDAGILRGRRRR